MQVRWPSWAPSFESVDCSTESDSLLGWHQSKEESFAGDSRLVAQSPWNCLPSRQRGVDLSKLLDKASFLQVCVAHCAGFKHLKKLSLANNRLHAFPRLQKLPALAELRLNGNQIASIPSLATCRRVLIVCQESMILKCIAVRVLYFLALMGKTFRIPQLRWPHYRTWLHLTWGRT